MEEKINELWMDYLCNKMNIGIIKEFDGMYMQAVNKNNSYKKKADENGSSFKSITLEIFQYYLNKITILDSTTINKLYKCVKNESGISESFDDLVKATIKSTIIILSEKKIKNVNEKYYDVDVSKFVYKCCVECSRMFYNHPYLFYHEYNKSDLRKNRNKIIDFINSGIRDVIIEMIPLKEILTEYLKKDTVVHNSYQSIESKNSLVNSSKPPIPIKSQQNNENIIKQNKKELSNVESLLMPNKIDGLNDEMINI